MQIFCPSCQRQLRVPDTAVGKTVKCPACQKTFTVGSGASAEQIQTPVAPRPTVPEAPGIEEDTRPRGSRRDYSEDDIDLRDDEEARRIAGASAVWLIAAALAALIAALTNIVMTLALGGMEDGPFDFRPGVDDEFLAGMICGLGGCGTVILSVVVLMIIAGLQLKSFGSKGWVITGIVLSFGLALLFGGGALVDLFYMFVETRDALDHWVPVTIILCGATAFLACFAGVKAIMALNHPAVSAELERNRSKRRRRRIRWED